MQSGNRVGKNLLAVTSNERKFLLSDENFTQIDQTPEELNFNEEFDIVLNAASKGSYQDHSCETHYVIRTRGMRKEDPNNFYTLAAETVVACFANGRRKIDKYHAITLHLEKARKLVNQNDERQIEVLEKIQHLADSVIDIFDFSI